MRKPYPVEQQSKSNTAVIHGAGPPVANITQYVV